MRGLWLQGAGQRSQHVHRFALAPRARHAPIPEGAGAPGRREGSAVRRRIPAAYAVSRPSPLSPRPRPRPTFRPGPPLDGGGGRLVCRGRGGGGGGGAASAASAAASTAGVLARWLSGRGGVSGGGHGGGLVGLGARVGGISRLVDPPPFRLAPMLWLHWLQPPGGRWCPSLRRSCSRRCAAGWDRSVPRDDKLRG